MSLIVNGNEYDYGSIEVRFEDIATIQALQGVKSINYSSSLSGGVAKGSDSTPIGSTPGDASHTAEMVLYRKDWNEFVVGLGATGSKAKLGLIRFSVVVEYSEDNAPVIQDTIVKAKISKIAADNAEGIDASSVRITLDPIDVKWGDGDNGQSSIYANDFFTGQVK
jgi:hypothetical protein